MRELLFADDSALVAHSAEEMQKIVDAFSDVSKKFGLKINIKKTEVLYQSNSTRTREEDIMVDGNKLNSVLEFTYLGSTKRSTHGHHSHSRETNGEQQSSDGSSLCRFATDSMMMISDYLDENVKNSSDVDIHG